MEINLWYIHISNHCVAHLKLIHLYVSYLDKTGNNKNTVCIGGKVAVDSGSHINL